MPDQPQGLMNLSDPDLLTNLGFGLMSAAKFGGNLGDAMSGAVNNYQRQKFGQQQLQMGKLDLMRQQMLMKAAMGSLSGPEQQPQQPQQAPQQQQPFLSAPTGGDVANAPINGIAPDVYRMSSILSGNPAGAGQLLKDQQAAVKQQRAGEYSQISSVVTSADPLKQVASSNQLLDTWSHYAEARGLDPKSDFTPENVRNVFAGVKNAYRSSWGDPEEAPPDIYDKQAVGGGGLAQTSRLTGKTDISAPQQPGIELEKIEDPTSHQISYRPVQKTPGFYPGSVAQAAPASRARAPSAPLGSAPPVVASRAPGTAGPDIPGGFAPPSAENNKAAMFGSEMSDGLKMMRKMENGGFHLTPKARAFAISMATDESASPMSQLFQQEIAAHGLTAQEQTYISAMMPLLQAAGHDQSGARLSTPQIRQNVESLLPFGSNNLNLQQVNKNREGFYQGLLTQAGSALQNPKYRNTLLADEKRAEQAGSGAPQHPPNIQALLKKYARQQSQ